MHRILLFLIAILASGISTAEDNIPERALQEINARFPSATIRSWSQGHITGASGMHIAFLIDQKDYASFPMRIVILTKNEHGQYSVLAESGSWFYTGRMVEEVKIKRGFLVYSIQGDAGGATTSYEDYQFNAASHQLALMRHTEKSFEFSKLTYKCTMDFEHGKKTELKGKKFSVQPLKKNLFTIKQFAAIDADIGAGDGVGGYHCE